MTTYQQILARHRHVQYPPEVEAKLARNRQKVQEKLADSGPVTRLSASMAAIMADHDCEGQMQVLLRLLASAEWHALWTELAVRIESFASLGVPPNTPDADLWRLCQTQQIILITGNRNEEGPASLEATLQASNTPTSLPVFDPQ